MSHEYLRPPDLRTHLTTSSLTSSRPRSKSATSSSSKTSFTSSFAGRLVEKAHDRVGIEPGAVRASLKEGSWSRQHQKTRSEDTPASYTEAGHNIPSPSAQTAGIGAIFDLVHHNFPPAINVIPPTASGSEVSDDLMTTNHQPQLGLFEAARLLSSRGCRVKFQPIPANAPAPAGRPVSPNPRTRPNAPPPPAQAHARADHSPEEALELVRRNGGEVEFPPRTQAAPQIVTCEVLGCEQTFVSDDALDEHRHTHPYCVRCKAHYAEHSHDVHIQRHH